MLGDDDGSALGDLLGAGDGSTDGCELGDGLGSIDIDVKSVRNNRPKNATSSSCTDWLSSEELSFPTLLSIPLVDLLSIPLPILLSIPLPILLSIPLPILLSIPLPGDFVGTIIVYSSGRLVGM